MTTNVDLPRVRKVAEVARALQRGRGEPGTWGSTIFLVGAGCSASAGIPLAQSIVRSCVVSLAAQYSNNQVQGLEDPDRALGWLRENKHFEESVTWDTAYGYVFENHYADPREQQHIIQEAIQRGFGINWFHLCVGELIAKRYVHTVLTTNFDQLVLEGAVRTGLIPVVADGIESLPRINGTPQHPQVVHLHGSMHTYSPRNSTTAVQEPGNDLGTISTLVSLLQQSSALVVVGYAGGEEGIMSLLIQAAAYLPDKAIFWILYDENPSRLSPLARRLLSFSRNSGVVPGQDADDFARQMMLELGLGGPEWMLRPVECLKDQSTRIAVPGHKELAAELKAYLNTLESLVGCLARWERMRTAAQQAVDAARRLRLAGDHAGAVEQLAPVAADANDPEIWMMLGASALEMGYKRDVERVEEAVDAFSAALPHYDIDTSQEEWAACQMLLGESLTYVGKAKRNPKLLQRAVAALEAVLQVRSRDTAPGAWASVQKRLALALRFLAQEETAPDRLMQSIAAYRAVLAVVDRATEPLEWADTQNRLGNALVDAGARDPDSKLLDAAAEAFRAALEVYTRNSAPDEWAQVQGNIGNALSTLAHRQAADPRLLHAAVDAFRLALEIQRPDRIPADWALTQNNLGTALRVLGEKNRAPEYLYEAISAFEAALAVRDRHDTPGDWAISKGNLANVLLTLGRLTGDVVKIREAITNYEEVLAFRSRDTSPVGWAVVRNNIAEAMVALARATSDPALVTEAIAVYREALQIFERNGGFVYQAGAVNQNLRDAHALLRKFSGEP